MHTFQSRRINQPAKEASTLKLNSFEQIKSISKAYSTERECSVQKAVYHAMPELCLRKTFPGVIYVLPFPRLIVTMLNCKWYI